MRPTMPGALAGAAITTHRISVVRSDLIFTTGEGAITAKQLRGWLEREAKKTKQASLLVLIGAGVPAADFTEIASADLLLEDEVVRDLVLVEGVAHPADLLA